MTFFERIISYVVPYDQIGLCTIVSFRIIIMVSCRMCMQSVFMNLIILVWSLMLDGYFISENRGIKSGLVYCELEGWILPV